MWQTLLNGSLDVPSCQDVNFSDQLETELNATTPLSLSTTPLSPVSKLVSDKATPSSKFTDVIHEVFKVNLYYNRCCRDCEAMPSVGEFFQEFACF